MDRVIEASATVVAAADGVAWVEAERRSGCSQCGSAERCETGALARLFGTRRSRFQITDTIGLRTGQRVLVGIPGATLLRASLLAYLLPLIALVASAAAATWLQMTEGAVALMGLGGLGAGLWLSGHIARRTSARERYGPTLIGLEPGMAPLSVRPPRTV